ncbi:hypothetical protein GCM10010106_13380 [Thermopolyspora flexuosa]|uniref:Dolichyl-phosphate-mannose-protein mannosyltransferase n=1 Tax=Thermopolyspora flexuosa TaxID=103836 RepID=A0A543IQ41_9ACTN|nr:hypothetical protein [Thermopolyspora flexuosa]PZN39471.1 MAG: hypothetical protein DIU60_20955 [Actinomycetota bacterium]TQM72691.1 hypothetical protein FHX40_4844 [Thermopolyspora flexuosa]GGM68620.1 hypothetical protein GCM10010106_13380 [Thermopolyspora flexuosa]
MHVRPEPQAATAPGRAAEAERADRPVRRGPGPARRVAGHPAAPLGVVALLFGALQLVMGLHRLPWGWDEIVYLSQVSALPDADFSAPRARGITWLAAPVAWLTAEPVPVRLWMTALATAGLFLCYLPWLRVLRAPGRSLIVAGAALLLAGLWVVRFYFAAVMPNLYVAYGAVAATGFLLLAARTPRPRGACAGLALSLAAVAAIRPGDALWLAAALGIAWLAVRPWRRPAIAVAVVAGSAAGAAPWVIEAYTRFGGLLARIEGASEIQGRLRPTVGFWYEFKALHGPLLCRPCTVDLKYPILSVWWLAIPFAVAGALWLARRTADLGPHALATGAAAALAAQYLFLVGYAAPRFLIPAYALLALPVAYLLTWTARRSIAWRAAVVAALALFLVVHHLVLVVRANGIAQLRAGELATGRAINALGVRPPCRVGGPGASLPLAYAAGCRYATRRPTPPLRGDDVAYLTRGRGRPTADYAGWRPHRVPVPGRADWVIWLPPR